MGSFSSKSKTSSRSSGTAVQNPIVPGYIQQPATNFYGQVNSLLGDSASAQGTPASANQNAAFGAAGSLSNPNQAILDAIGGTRGLMGYTPTNVQAGQLSNTDLSPYMNPYLRNVADTTMQGLERARAGAITSGQGNATLSGAYGGSRHGVADAETNRGYLDTAAATLANLYSGGFQNAQGAALSDIGNRLSADQFNVNSGLQGANLRLGAASQLGDQGVMQDANTRSNLTTQAGLGEMERQIAQSNDPTQARIARLQQIAQLLGINPSDLIGNNVATTGSNSSTTTGNNGFQIGWSAQNGLSLGYGG